MVELFACPKVTATLRVAEHCYQDIPVSIEDRATRDLFIDVDTRIIRRSSPVRPCSGEFPLRIRGDLSWWRIDPAIQAEPAPAQYARHPHASSPTHMDHLLGLYSESEKREWRQLQAMPAYKEALINEVERGTCTSMQDCPYAEGGVAAAAGGFDLGSLVPELPGTAFIKQVLDPWNWMNIASMLISAINLLLYLRLR